MRRQYCETCGYWEECGLEIEKKYKEAKRMVEWLVLLLFNTDLDCPFYKVKDTSLTIKVIKKVINYEKI